MNLARTFVTLGAALTISSASSLMTSSPASATSAAFDHPGAIALDGDGHLWIANQDRFGVTEVQASTGKVIRHVNAKADGFIDPTSIAVSGNNVWVVSGGVEQTNGTSRYGMATELNAASGNLVRTINLKKHGVTGLSAVSADSKHVWISADGGDQVVELSNATGRIVRVFRGRVKFVESGGIYSDGRHVWISSLESSEGMIERSARSGKIIHVITPMKMEVPPGGGSKVPTYLGPQFVTAGEHYVWTGNDGGTSMKLNGGSVTQIDITTGKIVRTIDTPADRFLGVMRDIVSDGTHVWIVNGSVSTRYGRRGNSVTELNDANGSLVRVVHLHNGIYSDPFGLASNGIDVWVVDQGGGTEGIGSVLEYDVSTGALVRDIHG
jgi:hypothetical protein